MFRRACGYCAYAAPNMVAAPAAQSIRRRRPSVQLQGDWQARGCLPMCWSARLRPSSALSTVSDFCLPRGRAQSLDIGELVGGAAWWLEPLRARLAEQLFASNKLFADDTPIPVLDPGRGRTRTGRLWVYARDDRPWGGSDPPGAVYFYSQDRRARTAGRSIRPLPRHPTSRWLCRVRTALWRAATSCWRPAGPIHGGSSMTSIRQRPADCRRSFAPHRRTHAIEQQVRGQSADERQTARNIRSRPVVNTMKPWLESKLAQVPVRSGLAEAIRYALTRLAGTSPLP